MFASVKEPVTIPGCKPASFARRFFALLVDMLILVLVTWVWMLVAFGRLSGSILGALLLVSTILRLVYFPICHGFWGQTPGKRLFRIRIIRGSGAPLTLWRGFLREIFSWPSAGLSLYALVMLWARLDEIDTVREYQRLFSTFYFQNFRVFTPSLLFGGIILTTLSLLFFWMNPDRRIPHDYIADTFVSQTDQ